MSDDLWDVVGNPGDDAKPGDAKPGDAKPEDAKQENFSLRLSGYVDEWKARQRDKALLEDASGARQTSNEVADSAAEVALFKSVHDAYVAVAQASLERSLQRATFVVTAASAIVTLYTGTLALKFSAAANASPLPSRAFLPALYLGGAVVLAAVYVAFLKRDTVDAQLLPSGTGTDIAEVRLRTFIFWTLSGVLARSWALRSATIALGFGVATLPIAFVKMSDGAAWFLTLGWLVVGLAAILPRPRPWEKPTLDQYVDLPQIILPEAPG